MSVLSEQLIRKKKTIGFVPTMGALHEGHLSLVRQARKENHFVVASIFVNPTQFGPAEDLSRYPRPFENDKALLEKEKCDFLFYPSARHMYPEGFETYVDVEELPDHLCGLSRPGHFRGVTTVVAKLFNIVRPATAYFGQKDYQQSVIIRKMVQDLNMPVQVRVMPVVREKDGLAMSSRNRYLSEKERKDAPVLWQALTAGSDMIRTGERDASVIVKTVRDMIRTEIPYAKIDYVSVADPETLEDLKAVTGGVVIALAVYLGKTRLIDNVIVR